MCFSHSGVFLFSVKPLTTENAENKTTPKICKITVIDCYDLKGKLHSKIISSDMIELFP